MESVKSREGLIFCCLLLQVDAWPHEERYRPSCESDIVVYEGKPSSITCHFPDNLHRYQLGFDVIRHDFEQLKIGDLILSCIWNGSGHECTQKPGYSVDMANIRETVTLEIPETRKEHAGKYICRYALSWLSDHTYCTLAIKEFHVSCTTPPGTISLGAEGFITCNFNSDLPRTRQKFYVYRFKDDPARSPTEVLYCTWDPDGKNDRPRCRVAPGYQFDQTDIKTNVTLKISSAEAMHSGTYSCRTLPFDKNVQVSDCSLSVQDEMTTDQTTTVEQGISGATQLQGLDVLLIIICLFHHVVQ